MAVSHATRGECPCFENLIHTPLGTPDGVY